MEIFFSLLWKNNESRISRFGTDEQYILWSNAIDMVEEMRKNGGTPNMDKYFASDAAKLPAAE